MPDRVLEPRQVTVVQTVGVTNVATATNVATTTATAIATPNTSCSGQYTSGALAGAIIGTFFGTILLMYLFNSLAQRRKNEVTIYEKRQRGSSRRHRSRSGSSSVRRPSRVYSTG